MLGQRGRFQADDIVRICLGAGGRAVFHHAQAVPLPGQRNLYPAGQPGPTGTSSHRGHSGATAIYNFGGGLVEKVLRSNPFFSTSCLSKRASRRSVEFALGIVRGLKAITCRASRQPAAAWGPPCLANAMEGLGPAAVLSAERGGLGHAAAPGLNSQTCCRVQNLALGILTSTTDDRFGHGAPTPLRPASAANRPPDGALSKSISSCGCSFKTSPRRRRGTAQRLVQYLQIRLHAELPVFLDPRGCRRPSRVRAPGGGHLECCALPEFRIWINYSGEEQVQNLLR